MPRTGKRSLEECHTETAETDVVATKETLEPAKKRGRKSLTKTVNLSKQRFESEAANFEISIDDKKYTMEPKKFKTGSVGWQYSGRIEVTVGDQTFSTRSNFLATVIKSKDWKETEEHEEEKENTTKATQTTETKETETKNDGEKTTEDKEKTSEAEKPHDHEDDHEHEHEHEEHEDHEHEEGEHGKNPDLTRKDFMSKAQNIAIHGFDKELVLKPKHFKTHTVGWYACGKSKRMLGDENLNLQVTLTLIVPNSKKWEEE